jgi:hypothetical protein
LRGKVGPDVTGMRGIVWSEFHDFDRQLEKSIQQGFALRPLCTFGDSIPEFMENDGREQQRRFPRNLGFKPARNSGHTFSQDRNDGVGIEQKHR